MAKKPEAGASYCELPDAATVLATAGKQHGIAKCRWCSAPFVQVYGSQWCCSTPTCVSRCLARAMPKQAKFASAGDTPILYFPLPVGVDMRESPHKRTLCAGAAGSAKSFTARWMVYDFCRETPGSRWLILRCTYDELNKNHLQYIPYDVEMLGDASWSGGNVRQVTFTNDSAIFCGFCEDKTDIPKLARGPEWDGILFEESTTFLPDALSQISARDRGSLTAKRAPGVERDGRTYLLSNPDGRSMLYHIEHYIERKPDADEYPEYDASIHGFIPATLEDNPYLPETYAQKTLSGLSAARYRQMRYGDWTVVVGQFFDAFESDTHVIAMEPA